MKQHLCQGVPPSEVIKVLEAVEMSCCPACHADHPYRWGHQAGLQRFRCRVCRRTYTTLSGTPLARLRHKEQWLVYSASLIQGLTIRAGARQCGIDKTTRFRWRHRFLSLPAGTKAQCLQGLVEADETLFPYSCKGQRHLDRPPHRRGKQTHSRGISQDQVPVWVVRDRSGATADFKLAAANKENIKPPLGALLAKDAILCTDGSPVYRSVASQLGIAHRPSPIAHRPSPIAHRPSPIAHRPVNLAAGIRVIAGVYHIQNVNAYDSRLKQWMRRFHGVATKYLENYLGWRRGLERWGERNSPIIWIKPLSAGKSNFNS